MNMKWFCLLSSKEFCAFLSAVFPFFAEVVKDFQLLRATENKVNINEKNFTLIEPSFPNFR